MNRQPAQFVRISAASLTSFVATAFEKCGMPQENADLLASLLVTNDMRGVYSHGSRQCAAYASHFKSRRLDPAAIVSTVTESGATLVLDGGGGLGYFPCLRLVRQLADKARQCGVAVGTTRNHGHFGAAGIYAREPLPHDMICCVTSGHQLNLAPEQFVMAAAGGSPMAFGIPCGEEPDVVLDFGAVHDMYLGPEDMKPIVELVPITVLRSFGLGCMCQALGGFLCGLPVDPPEPGKRQWIGADQGSLMVVIDITQLYPVDSFKHEMDIYAKKVRAMMPLPGIQRAALPGHVEHLAMEEAQRLGVAVDASHAELLNNLATEYAIAPPI